MGPEPMNESEYSRMDKGPNIELCPDSNRNPASGGIAYP